MSERITVTKGLLEELLSEKHFDIRILNHEVLLATVFLAEKYSFEIQAHEQGVNPELYYRVGYSYQVRESLEDDILASGYGWEFPKGRFKILHRKILQPTLYKVVWRKRENEYGPHWTPDAAKIAIAFGKYDRDAKNPVEILEDILKDKETLNGRKDYVQQAIENLKIRNCQ